MVVAVLGGEGDGGDCIDNVGVNGAMVVVVVGEMLMALMLSE